MIDICMLVTSDLTRDPRVQKEANTAHEGGYKIVVLCRECEGEVMPYRVDALDIERPERRIQKYIERIRFNLSLINKVRKYKPKLIHANDLDTLPGGFIAAKLTGAKLLFDGHELYSSVGRDVGKLGQQLLFVLEKLLVRQADAVVTVSDNLADAMAVDMGIEKPYVVLNAVPYVDTSGMTPKEWTKQFGGKKIVLWHGKYVKNRSLHEAIMAAKYLPDDVALVFRGYGPLEDELRQFVKEQGLTEKVHFVPPVAMFDLVEYAVGADIGLFPCDPTLLSIQYAAPNKIFEYIMAGLPCVATDTAEVRRILSKYSLGETFRPNDSEDMANVIVEMLSKGEELEKIKVRSLKAARDYSWDLEGEKLMNIYGELLSTA